MDNMVMHVLTGGGVGGGVGPVSGTHCCLFPWPELTTAQW